MKEYVEIVIPYYVYIEKSFDIEDWLYAEIGYGSAANRLNVNFRWHKFLDYNNNYPNMTFRFFDKTEAMIFKLTWIGI